VFSYKQTQFSSFVEFILDLPPITLLAYCLIGLVYETVTELAHTDR